jgi:hypothetical protein
MNICQLTGASFKSFSNNSEYDLKVNQKPRTNIQIGGTIGYQMTKRFSLLGELLLAFEGGKSETEHQSPLGFGGLQIDEFESYSSQFTKLNIPLLLKYNVSKKLSLETGPQMGIYLNATCSYEIVHYPMATFQCKFDVLHGGEVSTFINGGISNERGVSPLDFSFLFSTTYNVYKNIHLQARYVRGFSPINMNMKFGQSLLYSDFKSSIFQLSAEYKFQRRKRSH